MGCGENEEVGSCLEDHNSKEIGKMGANLD